MAENKTDQHLGEAPGAAQRAAPPPVMGNRRAGNAHRSSRRMLLYSEQGKSVYRGKSFWPTVFLMGLTHDLGLIRPETEDF